MLLGFINSNYCSPIFFFGIIDILLEFSKIFRTKKTALKKAVLILDEFLKYLIL